LIVVLVSIPVALPVTFNTVGPQDTSSVFAQNPTMSRKKDKKKNKIHFIIIAIIILLRSRSHYAGGI